MELLLPYITSGGLITTLVFIWLSLYFILTIWVWVSKYLMLSRWERTERDSLEMLLHGSRNIGKRSILAKCLHNSATKTSLGICMRVAEKRATSGLAILSVISSTAPFIGLFGTIVSILNTFAQLGDAQTASLTVIAPAISEALVATAAGIFVAIPAYSAHLLLKRKAYELMNMITRETELITSADHTLYE